MFGLLVRYSTNVSVTQRTVIYNLQEKNTLNVEKETKMSITVWCKISSELREADERITSDPIHLSSLPSYSHSSRTGDGGLK